MLTSIPEFGFWGSPFRHLWCSSEKDSCDTTWHVNWPCQCCTGISVQSSRQCHTQLSNQGPHRQGLPRLRYRTRHRWVIAPQYLEGIWSKCPQHDIDYRFCWLWNWSWNLGNQVPIFEEWNTSIALYAIIRDRHICNLLASAHRELAFRAISGLGHLLKMMYHPRSINFI